MPGPKRGPRPKPRRIDMSAGDRLADLSGELTPEELGVYTMIGWLEVARGAPIADDEAWIALKYRKTNPRTVRAAIERLVAASKVERNNGRLSVPWVRSEYENATNRIETWMNNLPTDGERSPEISQINAIAAPSAAEDADRAPAVPAPASTPATLTKPESAQHRTNALRSALVDSRFEEVKEECQRRLGDRKVKDWGRVHAWFASGADPVLDIYPAIDRKKSDWRSTTLDFFDGAIADSIATRTQPLRPGHALPTVFSPTLYLKQLAAKIETAE